MMIIEHKPKHVYACDNSSDHASLMKDKHSTCRRYVSLGGIHHISEFLKRSLCKHHNSVIKRHNDINIHKLPSEARLQIALLSSSTNSYQQLFVYKATTQVMGLPEV